MQFPIKKEIKKTLGIRRLLCFLPKPLTLWFLKLTITGGVSEHPLQLQNWYCQVPLPAFVLNSHDPQLQAHRCAQ